MAIGSLFSGIGGLELGLERAGLGPVVWQVEQDEFCRRVLEKHWPDADRSVTDVCEAGRANLEPVDIICGGSPCQDLSYAGKGAGLAGSRSGLWFEYLRIVRELRPRVVVFENVAAILTRGMGAVLGTLSDLGYDAVWTTLRASDVGAPHRRDRVFVVAYRVGDGLQNDEQARPTKGAIGGCDVAYPNAGGCSSGQVKCELGREPHGLPAGLDGHRWPSGPHEAQHEWEAPRTIPPENQDGFNLGFRAARLKALGNAVVPQCAEAIGWVVREIARSTS